MKKRIRVRGGMSSANEIRLYINNETYTYARYRDDKLEHGKRKGKWKDIKENGRRRRAMIKMLITVMLMIVPGTFLITFLLFEKPIIKVFSGILGVLIMTDTIIITCSIVFLYIMLKGETEFKKNHSAEHMMISFVESKNRLPRNIKELKKMSRFSPECGGRKLLQEELTFLMQIELPVVLIIIVTNILYLTIEIWLKILLITVLLLFAGLKKQKIINLKVIMVGYLVQCVTTAKDVKKENFLLAYTAAEEWLKVYEKN